MRRQFVIDHVTIAGPALAPLEQAFAGVGLATDYGGAHSNGITHMALLGFADGSYIELISSLEPGHTDTVFWGEHIAGNGGPCAWAVRVDDIAAEAARLAALGVTVKGPTYHYRRRPDGVLVEWELALLGDKGAGATLPFMIKDITPREWRVRPSASVAGQPETGRPAGGLTGVVRVILGVEQLEAAIELFQRVYDWPAPQLKEDPAFGANLAYFEATPVTLAAPLAGQAWLAERLVRFGASPCAYLLGARPAQAEPPGASENPVDHFEAVCQDFKLTQPGQWFERRVAWFEPAKLNEVKLGIID